MKRLVLILVLLCCVPAWASIAYVPASHTVCIQTTAASTQTCTLGAATTAGNTVVVGLSFKTTSSTLTSVVGSAATAHFYQYTPISANGSGDAVVQAICVNCPALTTVKPTFSGGTVFVTTVEEYSGVGSIGIYAVATGSSTAPSISLATSDANNWLVMSTSDLGSNGIPTITTGSLRDANLTGTTSSHVAGAACDNSVVSPGTVTCTVAITSGLWAAVGTELRSVAAPQSYIWPNCDSTHPCVIHHSTTTSIGAQSGESLQDFKFNIEPSKAGNLLVLAVTHPSAKTFSTPTDDKSNTWLAGPSTTNAGDHMTSEIWYKCGAATGTSTATLHFSPAIVLNDIAQFSYIEVSGIATSSCVDGTSTGANGLTGIIRPGAITTTQANSLVYNYAETSYQYPDTNPVLPWLVPDGATSLLSANMVDKIVSAVQVKASAGTVNPALYIVDRTSGEHYNDLAIAFLASSGAGTQPSGISVIRRVHFMHAATGPVNMPFPTSGNAFVMAITQFATEYLVTNVSDGVDTITQVTGGSHRGDDPQGFYSCSTTASGQRRVTWTQASGSSHFVFFDIAGAATGGATPSTACYDRVTFTLGLQSGTNAPITGGTITPTTSNGLILSWISFGTGPASAVTAPSGAILESLFATTMTDANQYDSGDVYLSYYNPNTSAVSFTVSMANGTATSWDFLSLALKAPAAASTARKRVTITR